MGLRDENLELVKKVSQLEAALNAVKHINKINDDVESQVNKLIKTADKVHPTISPKIKDLMVLYAFMNEYASSNEHVHKAFSYTAWAYLTSNNDTSEIPKLN